MNSQHSTYLARLLVSLGLSLTLVGPAVALEQFIYSYNSQGLLLSPSNAAAQCPNPETEQLANPCQGVAVNEQGEYELALPPSTINDSETLVILAIRYSTTESGYQELSRVRRIEHVLSGQENAGIDVNKLSEATVQAIEEHHEINLGQDRTEGSDAIPNVDADTLNQTMHNGRDDNDFNENNDEEKFDYVLKKQHTDELTPDELASLKDLATLTIDKLDDPTTLRSIEKNVEQALINPALLPEMLERVLTQQIQLLNTPDTEPLLFLDADRYSVHIDSSINLDTRRSLRADRFFGYTWLGVDSDTSTASFTRSAAGAYLVCVTGEIGDGNEGSSDCVRLHVKSDAYPVIHAAHLNVPLAEAVQLSAFLSVGADTYAWSGDGSFSDSSTMNTTWTAPNTEGTYSVTLTINGSDSQTILINVYQVIPLADATSSATHVYLDENNAAVSFTSSSISSDGSAVDSLLWQVVEQPLDATPTLSSSNGVESLFNTDVEGVYIVSLTATKGSHSAVDEIVVNVHKRGAPVADAGPDLIGFKNQLIALDGRNSYDPDNAPLSHDWSSVDGLIQNTDQARASFSSVNLGSFSASLTVNNGALSSSDETLIDIRNRLPLAGDDVYKTQLGDMLSAQLHAFDSDGDTLSYTLLTEPMNGGVTIDELSGNFVYIPGGQKGCKFHPYAKPFRNNIGGNDVPVIKLCADKYVVGQNELVTLTTSNSIAATKLQGFEWTGVSSTETNATFSSAELGVHEICVNGLIGNSKNTSTACVEITVKQGVTASDNPFSVEQGFIDGFTYQVNDGTGNSNIATVVLSMDWQNTAPIAADLATSTDEDSAVSGNLSASDIDGQLITFALAEQGSLGTLVIDDGASGAFTYTPNDNAHGTDSVTFTTYDGHDYSAPATVTIVINPINDAPIAADALHIMQEDSVYEGLLSMSDAENDALTVTLLSSSAGSNIVLTDASTGAFSVSPGANVRGHANLTYQVSDGLLDSNIATVTIQINNVNDRPTAIDSNTVTTPEDQSVNGMLLGEDIDGDALTYRIKQNGLLGQMVITDASSGAYTYTPTANANGTDRIDFIVNDGQLDSAIGITHITITPVNDAATTQDLSITINEDSSGSGHLLGQDIDEDVLFYSVLNNGTLGQLSITNTTTGAFNYTPMTNAFGTDTVTYQAFDGTLYSNTSSVTITINPMDDAPVANDAAIRINNIQAFTGQLDAFDVDNDPLTYSIVSQPSLGYAHITNLNQGNFSYLAQALAVGQDSFSYRVHDGNNYSNTATVSVDISSGNEPPLANDLAIIAFEGVPYEGIVSGSDPEGDPLSFALKADARLGSAQLLDANTGHFRYTPRRESNGEDFFTFVSHDGIQDSASATVSAQIVTCSGPTATGHDSDGDGYADIIELAYDTAINDPLATPEGMNPVSLGIDFSNDDDSDGFADYAELWLGSNSRDIDSVPTTSLNKQLPACISGNQDQHSPALLAFNILTPAITITDGRDVASFALSLADNMSGFQTVELTLSSPSGGQSIRAERSITPAALVANISFSSHQFGLYAEQGIWTVSTLKLIDQAGNIATLNGADLAQRKLPTNVTVTNPNMDPFAADLTDFSVLTTPIDVASGSAFARFFAAASDASDNGYSVTGIRYISATLTSPDGSTHQWGEITNNSFPATLNGDISTNVFSRYAPAGMWLVSKVEVTDKAGNSRIYDTAALQAAGFDYQVEVINSNIDTAPPILTDFDILTPLLYPETGHAKAGYNIQASDDKSGLRSVEVVLGPGLDRLDLAVKFTTAEAPLSIHQDLFTEALSRISVCGLWTVKEVILSDNAGNQANYLTEDLAAAGYIDLGKEIIVAYSGGCRLNYPPIVTDAYIETDEDTAVDGVLNATDRENDPLTFFIDQRPQFGSVTLTDASTGAYTYSPGLNYNGVDSFTFGADDGYQESNIATVRINVLAVNDPPSVEDMDIETLMNQRFIGAVTASDVDGDPLTYRVHVDGNLGSASFVSADINTFSYQPTLDAIGLDSLQVIVNDGTMDSEPGTVTVKIRPDMALLQFDVVTPQIVASEAFVTIAADVTLTKQASLLSQIRATLIGPSGQTIDLATSVSNSSVYPIRLTSLVDTSLNPIELGTWTFINLKAQEIGKFTVAISDDLGAAGFDPDVEALENLSPVCESQTLDARVGIALDTQLQCSDPDGQALSYRLIETGSLGTSSINNPCACFNFLPSLDGQDTITFVANDGFSDSAPATLTINIVPANDAPEAANGATNTSNNTIISDGQLVGHDSNGDALTYSLVSGASLGTVQITDANSGSFIYIPNANTVGTDRFTFKVNDGTYDSNIATFSIHIDVPQAMNDSLTVYQNVAYGGQLRAEDPNNDQLAYALSAPPQHGQIELDSSTGAFVYTPEQDYFGTDSLSFYVTAGADKSNTAIVSIAVLNQAQACQFDDNHPGFDADKDGYADVLELAFGTDPSSANTTPAGLNAIDLGIDFSLDTDADHFADYIEVWLDTNAHDQNSVPNASTLWGPPLCFDPNSDGIKPRLLGFKLETPVVNVANGDGIARFNLSLADNASGLRRVRIDLTSPSGAFVTASSSFNNHPLIDGVELSSDIFSPFAEAGTWLINTVTIYDEAGNKRSIDNEELGLAGFANELQITNLNSDATTPTLNSFAITTPTVDAITGNAVVSYQVSATDNGAGIAMIQVTMTSPGGVDVEAVSTFPTYPSLVDAQISSATLSPYLEDSLWMITTVLITDAAGNSAEYGDQLSLMGFGNVVDINNTAGDGQAPILDSFSVLTSSVAPASGNAAMSFAVTATDLGTAGIEKVRIDIEGPNGQYLSAWTFYFTATKLHINTQVDTAQLSNLLQEGQWHVTGVELFDQAGNSRFTSGALLEAVGLDTVVNVVY